MAIIARAGFRWADGQLWPVARQIGGQDRIACVSASALVSGEARHHARRLCPAAYQQLRVHLQRAAAMRFIHTSDSVAGARFSRSMVCAVVAGWQRAATSASVSSFGDECRGCG
jgi:hypothetical protein